MSKKPNILFFFTDQQRWDTCGCYGQRLEITPNLDRMAAEGVRFEEAFTCQPVCGPVRSVVQTGKYALETGCFTNGIALPPDEPTIAKALSASGYEVGYIGKWHLSGRECREKPVPPELRGGYADYWIASEVLEFTSHGPEGGHMWDGEGNRVEFPGYRVDGQTELVLDYLRTRKRERPWFLFLSYIEPHHQNDRNRYEGPPGSKERFKDYDVPGDLVDTEGDWRESFPDYLGACWSLDKALGRIRDELEKLGMADDTLVVFTSDHGSHFRTRNGEYKRACHDSCLRVPMVIRGPGFTGGEVVRELVSLIDMAPTVVKAGGVELPGHMRGCALQKLVSGETSRWRDAVFAQISESQVGRCIRTKRWKYSVHAPQKNGWEDSGSDRYVEEYLYDLDADPHERNNLVKDPGLAGTRAELAEKLVSEMASAGEDAPEIVAAE